MLITTLHSCALPPSGNSWLAMKCLPRLRGTSPLSRSDFRAPSVLGFPLSTISPREPSHDPESLYNLGIPKDSEAAQLCPLVTLAVLITRLLVLQACLLGTCYYCSTYTTPHHHSGQPLSSVIAPCFLPGCRETKDTP